MVMKYFLIAIICSLIAVSSVYGQATANAVWALTSNQSAVVVGNVASAGQSLTNMQVSYSSSVQRSSPTGTAGTWPGESSENPTRYMQFSVSPIAGNIFTVNSISMNLYANAGSGGRTNVYYSKDSTFGTKTQIGGTLTLGTTPPVTPNVTISGSIAINSGETIYLRIYSWETGATTGKYVITNNVIISGITQSSVSVLTSVNQLIGFVQQPSAVPSVAQTYTVAGNNLTNNVAIIPPAYFEISSDGGTTWKGNGLPDTLSVSDGIIVGQPITVNVRLNVSTPGSYSGIITHTSIGASETDVIVSGVRLTTEPALASIVSFGTVAGSSMVVNFSGGNGSNRIVVMHSGSAVNWVPTDGTTIGGANSNFSSASDQGNGNKIIYDGTGTSVNVTGLSSNVIYYVAVYEYNVASGNSQNYLTSSVGTGSQTTLAVPTLTVSKGSLSFGNVLVNTVSAEAVYSLSGVYLRPTNGVITVSMSAGFEVSATSGTGFASSIQIPYSNSTLSETAIYIHFIPTTISTFNGTVTDTGGSAPIVNIALSGSGVSELIATNTPVGFASCGGGTTGGTGGDTVVITNATDLNTLFTARQKNVTRPVVVLISGTLSGLASEVSVKYTSNVSILGIGNNAVLDGFGFKIWTANNIIVRNIKFQDCTASEGDAISVEACDRVWIDHCWFTDVPGDSSNEAHDGQTDIKKASTNITVSYNHYQHHRKTCLLGFSTSDVADTNSTVTYYRNWFDGTYSRHPRVRYAHPHILNNYFAATGMWGADSGGYAIGATCACQIYAEGNYFEHVRTPFLISAYNDPGGVLSHDPIGYLKSVNNYFYNCSGAITQDTDIFYFNPRNYYAYAASDPLTVKSVVMANAGVGILNIIGPAITTSVASLEDRPHSFILDQNYPNPFNPSTLIAFQIKERAMTTLKVVNILGQEAATLFNQVAEPGRRYQVIFNASSFSSGVYFSVLESGGAHDVKRMLLLK